MFFDLKTFKSSEFCHLQRSLHPYLTDVVEAINTLIQERHNHIENYITVEVCQRTQKIDTYLAIKRSCLF